MFHAIFLWILVNTNICCYEFWQKVYLFVYVCVCGNKAATSHSKIDIVKGWQQEGVCFKFRLLNNERNNHNLWEERGG